MEISIVVPLFNEEESLPELVEWINRVLDSHFKLYEIVLIDDGSTDRSWPVIRQLKKEYPHISAVRFQRNYGKSAALNLGFREASGEVIITLDADLQDNPDEIPHLYKMIREEGFDLVSGWKKKRHDPITKTLPSKFFNTTTRLISGIRLHDFNSGIKAYHRTVVKNIEVYGEMHRYIPVIAHHAGFSKIGEKVVNHMPRKYGQTKFGFERIIRGFLDLLSISFVGKFSQRPMHFFGSIGTVLILGGFGVLSYLSYLKIALDISGIADRPSFYLGFLLLILGVQLFIAGFLAEMISRSAPNRNQYNVADRL